MLLAASFATFFLVDDCDCCCAMAAPGKPNSASMVTVGNSDSDAHALALTDGRGDSAVSSRVSSQPADRGATHGTMQSAKTYR